MVLALFPSCCRTFSHGLVGHSPGEEIGLLTPGHVAQLYDSFDWPFPFCHVVDTICGCRVLAFVAIQPGDVLSSPPSAEQVVTRDLLFAGCITTTTPHPGGKRLISMEQRLSAVVSVHSDTAGFDLLAQVRGEAGDSNYQQNKHRRRHIFCPLSVKSIDRV